MNNNFKYFGFERRLCRPWFFAVVMESLFVISLMTPKKECYFLFGFNPVTYHEILCPFWVKIVCALPVDTRDKWFVIFLVYKAHTSDSNLNLGRNKMIWRDFSKKAFPFPRMKNARYPRVTQHMADRDAGSWCSGEVNSIRTKAPTVFYIK